MTVIAATAVLSCLNSGLYVASRMLHELARRGDAPAIFAVTSAQRVPRLGILFGTAAGFAAALASILSPNGVFLFLINTSGAIILFIYMLVALGQIRFRQRLQRQGERLSFKVWLFPWLSYAVIAGIVAVLVLMAFTPDMMIQLGLSGLSAAVVAVALVIRRAVGKRVAVASVPPGGAASSASQ
jgi:L-asparagine transporter-like permease